MPAATRMELAALTYVANFASLCFFGFVSVATAFAPISAAPSCSTSARRPQTPTDLPHARAAWVTRASALTRTHAHGGSAARDGGLGARRCAPRARRTCALVVVVGCVPEQEEDDDARAFSQQRREEGWGRR